MIPFMAIYLSIVLALGILLWCLPPSRRPPELLDTPVSPDSNVEAIRQKLLDRSRVGLVKYGVTTERDDLGLESWLTHLQEELLDASVYIEAAKQNLNSKNSGS